MGGREFVGSTRPVAVVDAIATAFGMTALGAVKVGYQHLP